LYGTLHGLYGTPHGLHGSNTGHVKAVNATEVLLIKPPTVTVTCTCPTIFAGTIAITLVAVTEPGTGTTEIDPKFTAVTPPRLVPVMVTVAPGRAAIGEMPVTVGPAETRGVSRNPVLVEPPGVVTVMTSGPSVPAGTVADIVVPLLEPIDAVVPLKVTVAPVKFKPVIVTMFPTDPLVGTTLRELGAATYV